MTTAIAKSGFSAAQLRIIRDTVAKGTDANEFDLFMEACRSYGLDPFRKQIHATVYSPSNPEKRKMTIIVSRDGLRVMAHRCNDYRPASEPAVVEYDEALISPTNPKGIVSATVKLWKQDNRGEWYPVIGEAEWDEYAPIKDEWAFDEQARARKPTGKQILDNSGQWAKMPKNMIVKCAEAQALRAGWPETFGSVYAEEEMHHVEAAMSASDAIEEAEKQRRMEAINTGITFIFDSTGVLETVKVGEVFDKVAAFLREASPQEVMEFATRNKDPLREFWAHDKGAALELKTQIETKQAEFRSQIQESA